MKKLVLLALLLNSCDWLSGNADALRQPNLQRLPSALYHDQSCHVNADCQIQGLGLDQCGNALDYVLYSIPSTDTSALNSKIHSINFEDALQWAQSRMVSSTACEVVQPLGSAFCDAGTCKYDPGFTKGSAKFLVWKPTQSYVWFKAVGDTSWALKPELKVLSTNADTLIDLSLDSNSGNQWQSIHNYTLFGSQATQLSLKLASGEIFADLNIQFKSGDTTFLQVLDSSKSCPSSSKMTIKRYLKGAWALCSNLDSI